MYDLFNVSLRRIIKKLSKILSGNKNIPFTCNTQGKCIIQGV